MYFRQGSYVVRFLTLVFLLISLLLVLRFLSRSVGRLRALRIDVGGAPRLLPRRHDGRGRRPRGRRRFGRYGRIGGRRGVQRGIAIQGKPSSLSVILA